MSKYTTEVRFICENYAGLDESEGNTSVNDVIEKARTKVFNFDFPIYDESYRSVLETKIIKHYYTREIGFETVGLWERFLDMKMNEIMPYYNQLYKSATLEFNPLYDVDLTTQSNRGINGNEKTTDTNVRTDNLDENITETATRTDNLKETNVNNNTRTDDLQNKTDKTTGTEHGHKIDTEHNLSDDNSDRYSETPQGSLTGVTELQYLTNARMKTDSLSENSTETHSGLDTGYENSTSNDTGTQTNEGGYTTDNTGTQENTVNRDKGNTGTQTNEGNGNKDYKSTDEYLEHVAGKRGGMSYSQMLLEYRQTFLNIDMMIINELADLFMNLW